MILGEALDVLRKGNGVGALEDLAVEIITAEVANGEDLQLTLALLANELLQSRNPSHSFQILRSLVESQNGMIEDNFLLRTLFINENLASESVRDGILKCMVALEACTRVYGDDPIMPE